MASIYLMIGGFLGAGKTTTLRWIGRHLQQQGKRVGLITNDQAQGLVDTALGRAASLPTQEIAGGCFCCRFHSLLDAARSLTQESRPEVFLAEPVGSCTDLVATVGLPLQQIYGTEFRVAPFSVLVDPLRAERIFGLGPGRPFAENVRYIYLKQLEEAEHLVVNKVDLLEESRLQALEAVLEENFPSARLWRISGRTGAGIEKWLEWLLAEEMQPKRLMELDYQKYAQGEAQLGWLNATVDLQGEEWDGNAWLQSFAQCLCGRLEDAELEVAHLKMVLSRREDPYELAAIHAVRSQSAPELSHRLADPLEEATLLINCRCQGEPDLLASLVRETLTACARQHLLEPHWHRLEHFKPAPPVPTHGRVQV